MPSTTETGTAKRVANFEDLISFCTSYGATYNPSKQNLKLSALNTLRANAKAAVQAVKTAKTNYDNACNAREIAFKQLKAIGNKSYLRANHYRCHRTNTGRCQNNKQQNTRKACQKNTTSRSHHSGRNPNTQKNNFCFTTKLRLSSRFLHSTGNDPISRTHLHT